MPILTSHAGNEFVSRAEELRETFGRIAATRRHSKILRAASAELKRQSQELQLAAAHLARELRAKAKRTV